MKTNTNELVSMLMARKSYLENLQKEILKHNERLASYSFSKIRVIKHNEGFQYYIRANKKDIVGKYARKSQHKLVRQILQNEYYEKSLKIIKMELALLNTYLSKTSPNKLMKYYEDMNEGRKIMINPIEIDDYEYIKRWNSISYVGKTFHSDDDTEYYTDKNERVRSKSEIIIANTLKKYSIPYRYEYPIEINGKGMFYPDFTILNVKKRKEIYWEHFGIMDDSSYRDNALRKIALYEENNMFLGDNLIITFESSSVKLNVKEVERKIKKYLI